MTSFPRLSSVYRFLKYNYVIWYSRLTNHSYEEAYREHIDTTVARNPKEALGGWDNEVGELQFEFMKERGLSPEDTLLDLGCGTLRGGQYYLGYLETGNYTGMDLSEEAIEEGKELVGKDVIKANDPVFIVNNDLQFTEFNDTFDWIIAQSVFTHMKRHQIEECLSNISKVMHENTRFFATYKRDDEVGLGIKVSGYTFAYDFEDFETIATPYGLTVREFPYETYPHPRNQRMLEFRCQS